MELTDTGLDLIKRDLKRLKKYRSLKNDLENYFKIHDDSWKKYRSLSCMKASGKNYIICKQRIGIKNPKLSPSEGGRLWFVVDTSNGNYYRCLLYLAREEPSYPKSKCFKIVHSLIESLLPSS